MTEPTSDPLLNRYGFKYAATKAIVDYLERNGFATVSVVGSTRTTRLEQCVPNPELASALVSFHLQTVTDIEPQYIVSMNQKVSGRKLAGCPLIIQTVKR